MHARVLDVTITLSNWPCNRTVNLIKLYILQVGRLPSTFDLFIRTHCVGLVGTRGRILKGAVTDNQRVV